MANSSKRLVVYAALAGNTLIALSKLGVAAVTGSSAMLAEGVHSVVDTGNEGLLLYGMHRAKQPPDAQFPFGHGKEVYFWSFVVAILIFAVGAGVSGYEGIQHLLHPQPMEDVMWNYAVLSVAMLFEGATWLFALREFRHAKGKWGYVEAVHRGKDPTLFMVLFEDSAATTGLLVAFAGVLLTQLTGNPAYDGAASLGIATILGGTAIWLAYETKGLLIGESANRGVVEGIRELTANTPCVQGTRDVLTLHMGPDFILVTVGVDFAEGATVAQIAQTTEGLDRRIKERFPNVKRVFIEAQRGGASARGGGDRQDALREHPDHRGGGHPRAEGQADRGGDPAARRGAGKESADHGGDHR